MKLAVILVWKLWTVYAHMFAVTAILSCVIKIRGLSKSIKFDILKMSNLKLSQPGVLSGELIPLLSFIAAEYCAAI